MEPVKKDVPQDVLLSVPPIYTVSVWLFVPGSDYLLRNKVECFKDKEQAINAAKNLLFEEIDKTFEGGVRKCTGIDFDLEKIETYDQSYILKIWNTYDEDGTSGYHPRGGIAHVVVHEFLPTKTGAFERKEIYMLPNPEESCDEAE
jgi:hypothetical protein